MAIAASPYVAAAAVPMPNVKTPMAMPATVAAIAPQSQPYDELPVGSTMLIGSPSAYSYALNVAFCDGSGCRNVPRSGEYERAPMIEMGVASRSVDTSLPLPQPRLSRIRSVGVTGALTRSTLIALPWGLYRCVLVGEALSFAVHVALPSASSKTQRAGAPAWSRITVMPSASVITCASILPSAPSTRLWPDWIAVTVCCTPSRCSVNVVRVPFSPKA